MQNLDLMIQAARQAAVLCRTVQRNYLLSNTKTDGTDHSEPVTIADYGAQAIICRAIQAHFPDDAVIAEESGEQFATLITGQQRARILDLLSTTLGETVTQDDVIGWLDYGKQRTARRTWVIDPIDGTKGFVAMRHYAVAIGIVEDGIPTGGVMACPGYENGKSSHAEGGAIFYVKANAVWREPLAGGAAQQVHVSEQAEPSRLQIVQSFEKQHASKERMAKVRDYAGLQDAAVSDLDSMEKYALVACGDAELYMRLPRPESTRPQMAWDHAAGVALVHAAGGKATDVDGSPLDFSQGRILPNQGMIVSNGRIHQQVINAVKQVIAEESA